MARSKQPLLTPQPTQTQLPGAASTTPTPEYAKMGFNRSYTAILQDHYFEEWKDFIRKVNPEGGDSGRIPAITEWKNETAAKIMKLIERGDAPWDKCQKLNLNDMKKDIDKCVRWFTNQRVHKLVKHSDGLMHIDTQKAIDKVIGFSSVVKPRKLFQDERKDEIMQKAAKLTDIHQAARWSVAESQMWKAENQEQWEAKAKEHYSVDDLRNQAELQTLLQLLLDAITASGHVGPFQVLMLISTRDSDGHVDTGMVEGGSSKTEFIKTWKAGQNSTECEQEAHKVFRGPFDKWAKEVLPFQAVTDKREGELASHEFNENEHGHLLFPAIDTLGTPPGDVVQLVESYLEQVFEQQHGGELPWSNIVASLGSFYDTMILTCCMVNLRDSKGKGSVAQVITLAEQLQALPFPFRFYSSLKDMQHPSDVGASGGPSVPEADKEIASGSGVKKLTDFVPAASISPAEEALVEQHLEDQPVLASNNSPSPVPVPVPVEDNIEHQSEDNRISNATSSKAPTHTTTGKKGGATKKRNKKTVGGSGGEKVTNAGNNIADADAGIQKATSKKRKRAVDDESVKAARATSATKKQKKGKTATEPLAAAETVDPPQVVGRRAKAGKFWSNVVEPANKKGLLEQEPEVLQSSSCSGRVRN
ncbi:hypothetical protein PQX77_015977 [Marasmius sp. AFHP31]|nr:hypothetical protein PQX77_015977 [Marasmius sp. AFHP31]